MEITKRFIATMRRDEGVKSSPYRDSEGILTIGIGHNIEDNPLNEELQGWLNSGGELTDKEINDIFTEDVQVAIKDVENIFAESWESLSQVRKEVLVNMAFNLGGPRLRQFKKMIAAVNDKDYAEAGTQMLDSRWARQVGNRSKRLARAMVNDDSDAFEV